MESPESAPAAETRRGFGFRRRTLVLLAVLLMLATGGVAAWYGMSAQLAGGVQRVPHVFSTGPHAASPGATRDGSLTFVVAGSDSRLPQGAPDAAAPGNQRSDVIEVLRLAADRRSATVVAIPRDSWVPIPGHGPGKINSAYAYGGPRLLVRTVEQLTGARVDHFAAVDFAGFQRIVDTLGGVDVTVAEPTETTGAGGPVRFVRGTNHLGGAEALAYVRQRHGLPRGDLDRVQRQQNLVRAVLRKVSTPGQWESPQGSYELLSAVASTVRVDATLSNGDLQSLAMSLGSLRQDRIRFLTAPVAGFDTVDGQSVVRLDTQRGKEFWSALHSGCITGYLAHHRADVLGEVPR